MVRNKCRSGDVHIQVLLAHSELLRGPNRNHLQMIIGVIYEPFFIVVALNTSSFVDAIIIKMMHNVRFDKAALSFEKIPRGGSFAH